MNAYKVNRNTAYSFFTLVLSGGEWPTHARAHYSRKTKRRFTMNRAGFDPTVSLDDMERRKSVFSGGIRIPDRPDHIHKTDNGKGM